MTAKAAVLGRKAAEEAFFSFPIIKKEYTPEGDLMVYGPCTDGTRDSDHQKVDPNWSGKALETWIATGGNMRVQHSPFLYPAGKGLALETFRNDTDQHWLKALVLKTTPAFDLVEKGVLRDFSIGVLDPVTLFNDPTAPAGTICGGEIGEVSLVDRGSNKNTTFTIIKSARKGPAELVLRLGGAPSPATVARMIGKRKMKDGQVIDSGGKNRTGMADQDFAGPNKTYPIETRADVPDAASLAHHADNPAGVRSSIRSIARRKFGMKDDEMPPSLKAEDDECGTCHGTGKIMDGHRDCPDCSGPVNKGDGSDDYPGDKGESDEEPSDYADDEKDSGQGDDDKDEAQKAIDAKRLRKKLIKQQRRILATKGAFPDGDNGGNTPEAMTGEADPKAKERGFESAADKKMKPAGKHREPDGDVVEELEKDGSMHTTPDSAAKSAPETPSFAVQRMHDLVCPAYKAKQVRKVYGIQKSASMFSGLPERELQSLAMKAVGDGDYDLAGSYAAVLDAMGTMSHLGPEVLLEARKAFPEMFPNAHPSQQHDVRPSQFTHGYLSGGHPPLHASGVPSGVAMPEAPVHHVASQDFQRGFISTGRADPSPGEGTQATAGTAAFGQALNSMAVLHHSVSALWPDMCPVSPEVHDFAHSPEGHTGIRPSQRPSFPDPVTKAAAKSGDVEGRPEPALRKLLAKSQTRISELEAENQMLGSLPSLDPDEAPYRGIPELSGPVDRRSLVGKAVGGAEDQTEDREFREYVESMAQSGDPKMRTSANKVLTELLTK